MKFLQFCLCTCLAVGGVVSVRAQQTLTPEQQKQALEALRKALDQPPGSVPTGVKQIPPAETLPASDLKPVEKPVEKPAAQSSKDAEAKAKAEAKLKAKAAAEEKRLLEEENRALEQQKRYEAKRTAELEAQAKRDADLRAKKAMKAQAEAETKRGAETPKTATPVVVQTPAPPLTAAPASTTVVAASAPGLSADQNNAAREALRRALDQPATPSVPLAAPATLAQPEVKTPAASVGTVVVAPPAPTESQTAVAVPAAPPLSQSKAEAARAALRSKLEAYEAATPVTATPVTPAGQTVQPSIPVVETKLPATKSQRLADLLNSYRRDQITPAEYHSQRAKILAEPN